MLARRGAGPLPDDIALPGGLYQASRGRALAENTRQSRSRGDRPRRTLNNDEFASWIDPLCQSDGEEKLRQYRARAEALVDTVGASVDRIAWISQLIGAAFGSQQVPLRNPH